MKRAILAGACTLALLVVAAPPAARADETGPRGPFGTIEAAGVSYRLTEDDALWAARMLVGESGGEDDPGNAAVLWCMINSYALRPVRGTYKTFTDFIRAYCTPLQPYLKSKGAIERHRKLGTKMVEVEPGKWQLARHVDIQKRPWAKLPAGARALVERVFRGEGKSVCGNATQFCSTAVYYRDKHGRKPTAEEHAAYTREYAASKKWVWFEVEGGNPFDNCFFEEERFAALPRPAVKVAPPERSKR
jgi:hypothetical protein